LRGGNLLRRLRHLVLAPGGQQPGRVPVIVHREFAVAGGCLAVRVAQHHLELDSRQPSRTATRRCGGRCVQVRSWVTATGFPTRVTDLAACFLSDLLSVAYGTSMVLPQI
jgi:hypothetical protein